MWLPISAKVSGSGRAISGLGGEEWGQADSAAQSCLTLCDPMDCSTPGFPVHHYLPEFAQTHVHWVSDAIQPSHPLPSPSPPALSLSQHQGLFQCQFSPSGGQSIGASASASVLPMIIQDWFPLGLTGLISVQSKGLSGVFSSTTIWKHQVLWHSAFLMVQLLHLYVTTGKAVALTIQNFVSKVLSLLYNLLSRFVIALSSKEQASFNFTAAVSIRFRICNNLVKSEATDSENGWPLEEYI